MQGEYRAWPSGPSQEVMWGETGLDFSTSVIPKVTQKIRGCGRAWEVGQRRGSTTALRRLSRIWQWTDPSRPGRAAPQGRSDWGPGKTGLFPLDLGVRQPQKTLEHRSDRPNHNHRHPMAPTGAWAPLERGRPEP